MVENAAPNRSQFWSVQFARTFRDWKESAPYMSKDSVWFWNSATMDSRASYRARL
jgi:hypothetical protein